MSNFDYKPASERELNIIWDENIADHPNDGRWKEWKKQFIDDNKKGKCKTFVFTCDEIPVGEGTLLFSPECAAISGRTILADGKTVANINALRNDKNYENKGHISKLVKVMEGYAKENGYTEITIGVEEKEIRNRMIYKHWGYERLVLTETEDGEKILYYGKKL